MTVARWCLVLAIVLSAVPSAADEIAVFETDDEVIIKTDCLEAVIRKTGYISGVAAGSLLDVKSLMARIACLSMSR